MLQNHEGRESEGSVFLNLQQQRRMFVGQRSEVKSETVK